MYFWKRVTDKFVMLVTIDQVTNSSVTHQHRCCYIVVTGTENRYNACQNRFIEIPEVHGVSHNLLHTDWTRPSLILLNSSVNWVQVDLNKQILSQRLTQWMIGKSLLQHSSWLVQHPSGFQAANCRPQNRSLSPFQPSKISTILKKLNFWKRLKTLIHSFKSLYVTRNLTKSLL